MKKVLAFVLVLAMVLGSVSMAFAATTNYADDAAITNKEAVGVLSGLKVLEGDANGFRPADTLTRAEAAAIIARLLLGRDDADKLTASAALFTDVPANHWAAGYIAYCVSQGIIAGNGDGTFTPDGVLTVPAFGKMLLCALGYDAQVEGLVGSNWEANTASLMVKANIAVSATGACTRDTAALMALKTLEADIVEYASKGVSVNTGSAQVVVGGSAASKPAYGNTYKYNGANDSIEQLAERVYKGKLTKNIGQADKFGRPGNEWTYTGSIAGSYVGAIGTFGKEAAKVFTAKMTASQVNSELNGYKVKKGADFESINNTTKASGAAFVAAGTTQTAVETNKGGEVNLVAALADDTLATIIAALTGDGKVVEVYVDGGVVDKFVIIQYTSAKVSSVSAGKSYTTYSFTDLAGTGLSTGRVYTDGTKDQDTITLHGTFAKNDIVTYVDLGGTGKDIHVYPTTKVSGDQTAYTTGTHTTITVDGTAYTVGTGVLATAATPLAAANFANGSDINIYLDQYGFAVKSDSTEDTSYAYVYKAGVKDTKDALGNVTVTPSVQVVLADGTVATYTVATKTSNSEIVLDGFTNGALTSGGKTATVAAVVNAVGNLAGEVVTYSINGDTIKIKAVVADQTGATPDNDVKASASNFKADIDHVGTVDISSGPIASDIAKNTAKFVDTALEVVANAGTNFVILRSDKDTATTYTSLPKIASGKNVTMVAVYASSSSISTVKTAFIVVDGAVSKTSSAYAYIAGNAEVTESKSGDDKVYAYVAYDKDGEKISVTRTNDTITKATVVAIDANNAYVDIYSNENAAYVVSGSATVSDEIVKVGTKYYKTTDKTATVLVGSDVTKVNGNDVVLILDDTANHTDEILTIYVFGGSN